MDLYTIRTDSDILSLFAAESYDDAARIYAETNDEFAGCETWAELCDVVRDIGNGAWIWIDGPNARRMFRTD